MLSITEERLLKIFAAVQEAAELNGAVQEGVELNGKKEDRRRRYNEVLEASRNGRPQFSMQCRDCRLWCIKRGLEIPIWGSEHEGAICPLCGECRLTRASIV